MVWYVTQFSSVGFLQSAISVQSVFSTEALSRFASVVLSDVLVPSSVLIHAAHLRCPCIDVVAESMFKTKLRAFEGHHVGSKSPQRVRDQDEGVARSIEGEEYSR